MQEPLNIADAMTLETALLMLGIVNTVVLFAVSIGLKSFQRAMDSLKESDKEMSERIHDLEISVAELKALRKIDDEAIERIESKLESNSVESATRFSTLEKMFSDHDKEEMEFWREYGGILRKLAKDDQ